MSSPIALNQTDTENKRCKRGTRKNKITGKCDPIEVTQNVIVSSSIALNQTDTENKRCKRGTRKNKITGKCDPIANEQEKIQQISENLANPVIENEVCENGTKCDSVSEVYSDEEEFYTYNENVDSDDDEINDNSNEMKNFEYNKSNNEYDFLYPDLNDPHFNIKIAKKKEFNDTQYDGTIHDIKKQSDILCNVEFELMPHQLFVKNFLSLQTPYNGLLLYHGLGSGKTCSAIGIAEEMRSYMKQMDFEHKSSRNEKHHHIIVVAAPNVQINFQMQLFDPSKLKKNEATGEWNIRSCVGNSLLNEINPAHVKGLSYRQIVTNMNSIISSSYRFFGYIEFTNYAQKYIYGPNLNEPYDEKTQIKNVKRIFSNRLIIIDEVHNIRTEEDNRKKMTSKMLFKIVEEAENVRLLLLSATPMYNSYKEIIWITNLLNVNDKRPKIRTKDVFDENGFFKTIDDRGNDGRTILQRKLTGYVSYVRGENPYTFPYRIYPDTFDPSKTFSTLNVRPTLQLNDGREIEEPIKLIQPYLTKMNSYQEKKYLSIIDSIRNRGSSSESDEVVEKYGYETLQVPIQALNIVYPSIYEDDSISKNIGKLGLQEIMSSTEVNNSSEPYTYDYKPETLKKFGRVFKREEINKYSSKISKICDIITRSTGNILIYSQYIEGGLIPIALALEEIGFNRFGTTPNTKNLLSKQSPQIEPIDSLLLKPKDQVEGHIFRPAKYIMITGKKSISQDNSNDLAYFNSSENKYGENVKVVLISKAGAEGLDFKNVRQIHIMEPWYNMNRIEQIIGRGVRNLSHCNLPFEERNVEIYLHATLITNDERSREECVDLYVYRMAERKSIKIGNVTRLIKESSVDCILNVKQSDFTVDKLNSLVANQNIVIKLSTDKKVTQYTIGDRPFTDACDYKDKCELVCNPSSKVTDEDIVLHTYSSEFVTTNNIRISDKIKELFKTHHFYKREEIISFVNMVKPYPIEQIYNTLTYLVNNKNEYLVDSYGRAGFLENKGDVYLFKPTEIGYANSSLYERSVPVEYSRQGVTLHMNHTELIKGEEHLSFNEIMKNIILNDQHIFSVINSNHNDDFYSFIKTLLDTLVIVHRITKENIRMHVVHHFLDTLLINDKITLCKELFKKKFSYNVGINDLENIVYLYFQFRVVDVFNTKCVIITDSNENFIYKISDWTVIKGQQNAFSKFNIPRKKLNNSFIGFYSVDKGKSSIPVFKVQNMLEKRKGILIEKSGKSNIIDVLNVMTIELNEIQKNNYSIAPYTDSNTKHKIKVVELCILLEIIMREIRHKLTKTNFLPERYVFLSPEETVYL
jgi:superfamily II DNA or RNA helicase